MVNTKGINLFYKSSQNRKECCYIRKVDPLARALSKTNAWITGLRQEQSVERADIEIIQWDQTHQIVKINPLVQWSNAMVWDYIKKNKVPYNILHDLGYSSIGCAPCTRAIKKGESFRAGRWWWETEEQKECGLHLVNGKLVSTKNKKESKS